jgi:hypothetical protein
MVPCCGCSCTIYANDFSAALSGFTTTGSPSTSGGLLVMTAGDRVISTTTPSSASDSIHLTTGALTTDATATLRLICAWVDSSNYLFGEVARAAGAITLRLGQVAGGVSTWLTDAVTVQDTGADLDERHVISLCWTPGPVLEEEEGEQSGIATAVSAAGWTDPDNALLIDGTDVASYATSTLNELTPQISWFFAFSIPPGANNIRPIATVHHADQGSDSNHTADYEVYVFDGSGAEVGDNQALGALIGGTFPPAQVGTWGDGTDDFNAGLDWRDVNSSQFGFSIVYENVSGDSTAVVVDGAYMAVHFTAPERRVGRLTLAYGNTSVAETDCVTDYSVVLTGDGLNGKAAGLAVTAGDWDFDAFTLSYLLSDSRPTCPSCGCTVDDAAEPCECCDPAFPPAQEYTVDIGTPGMTDNECDGCDQISGTYVLSGEAACFWRYEETLGTCDGPAGEQPGILSMTLRLVPQDGGGCKWIAFLAYYSTQIQDPSDPSQTAEAALYEVDLDTDEDCQTPITLTQTQVYGTACNGSFPATIDIAPV